MFENYNMYVIDHQCVTGDMPSDYHTEFYKYNMKPKLQISGTLTLLR